jgi:xylulokinase
LDELLLGIDVGTTGAKAALVSPDGRLRALGRSEYGLHHLRPGWVEQDPEDWWQAVCLATRQALGAIPNARERVLGVAVSSQAPALLPLSRTGAPLRPAMIWMDRRAEAEVKQLDDILGEGTIYRVTGNRPDAFYVGPKLLWFKKHEPQLLQQTFQFVQVNGYINYRLTGEFSLDSAHASLLQLRDSSTEEWYQPICDVCGIESRQFPEVKTGHEHCGALNPAAAEATGLRAGTPVMVGTVDSAAAALEVGAAEPGVAAEMTGTSTVLIMPNREGLTEPAFIAMRHAIPEVHLLLGAMVATGASLRWFRDELGEAEVRMGAERNADPFDLLTEQAAQVPVGSRGVIFLPYMAGERSPLWHTQAKGMFFGLSLATPKAALIRAILEGTVFALAHNVEVARRAGIRVSEMRSVGGGTRSSLWNQIKADVLGMPVQLPRAPVGAAFGDAVLAGLGLGLYPDFGGALRDMVRLETRYEPNRENHLRYQEIYKVYRSLYEHLKTDFDELSALGL